MKNKQPWGFCETPEEKCTMNYCDDNGCQNRQRNYVQGNDLIVNVSNNEVSVCLCKTNNISIVFNGVAYCEDCGLEINPSRVLSDVEILNK